MPLRARSPCVSCLDMRQLRTEIEGVSVHATVAAMGVCMLTIGLTCRVLQSYE